MTIHPDLEALSAAVDGEDAEGTVATHVGTCGDCRARMETLRRARQAVAAPVEPLDAAVRERMLAAALAAAAAAGDEDRPGRPPAAAPAPTPLPVPLPVPDRRRWWTVGAGAAAAVLAVVVGAAGLLGRGAEDGGETALSRGPAAEESADASAGAAGDAGASAAPGPPAGVDLGDVPDVAALRSRIPPAGVAAATGQGPSERLAAGSPSTALAPVPREIGTRPCEEQARTARPGVQAVVYVANARFAGTPAVVLGFAPTPGSPPSTVLVLAESGCRLLAETALP
ncbi:MAG: hypothetical protein ACLGI2_06480 [Acidimicrobiia bacterium]